MASTVYFTTDARITARLGEAGVMACADDDADDYLHSDELSEAITEAKEYAKSLIEVALQTAGVRVPFTQDDANLNIYLAIIAEDLAIFRLAGRRARSVSDVLQNAHDNAERRLKDIAARKVFVPGLTYPNDGDSQWRAGYGRPVAANPRQVRR